MKDLVLSPNVKQYFVHALKGLGMREGYFNGSSFKEMSEARISQLLDDDNVTTGHIYVCVNCAILQQFQNDARSAKKLEHQTAYNRKTVQNLFVNGLHYNNEMFKEFLYGVNSGVDKDGNFVCNGGVQLELTIARVFDAVMAGVANQNLTVAEKEEARKVWKRIRNSLFENELQDRQKGKYYDKNRYEQWLVDGDDDYYKLENNRFKIGCMEEKLIDRVANVYYGGDDKKAENFLYLEVPNDEIERYLGFNIGLMKKSQKIGKERYDLYKDPDAPEIPEDKIKITYMDLLLATDDVDAQVVTFFQSRSNEQKAQHKNNPRNSEVKKENKIGNVLGKSGREQVKREMGGAIVDYDVASVKKGAIGPWRGYKALFDRMTQYFGNLYGNLQAIGFSEALFKHLKHRDFAKESAIRNYTENSSVSENDPEKGKESEVLPWDTGYKEMPAEYETNGNLNVAGNFYDMAQARLLSDKILLADLPLVLNKNCTSQNQTDAVEAQKTYLKQRIERTTEILTNDLPDKESPYFQDQQYYNAMEEQIIDENAGKNNPNLKSFIDHHKNDKPNEMMCSTLGTFYQRAKNGISPLEQKIKREMAKDIFNIRNNEISNEDLDGMIQRFINSKGFKSMFDCLKKNRITATEAMSEINKFVIKDLQKNVVKDQYNSYFAEQQSIKTLDSMMEEGRER